MDQQYVPFVPTTFVQSGKNQSVELAGRDRFKFFKRPVVPLVDQVNPSHATLIAPQLPVLSKPQMGRPLPALDETAKKKKKMRTTGGTLDGTTAHTTDSVTRDVLCQTDMRENECQTDPYTPDYYVEEGTQPQVLALMEVKYGNGLPAGLAEIEMIDRVKRRTQVESELPQSGDDAAMNTRLKALEELEQVEWNEREEHIKQLQDDRLNQMATALEKRERKREAENSKRIEAVKQEKLDKAERKLNRLQEKRMSATRKLAATHTNPSKEAVKKDIIANYSTHGKRGKQVEGCSLIEKTTNANYDVRPTLLGFPEGVQELERTKAPKLQKVKQSDIVPPVDPAINQLENNFRKRAAKQVVHDLAFAQETIDKAKAGAETQASIQDFYRATPRLVRPDTPTLVLQGDQDEEKEEALVLLQRLLRGRAVQNEFFEGKERCHGLIEELQAASRAKETEAEWKEKKEADAYTKRQEIMVNGVIDQIQGDILFGSVDYLMKELTRQREIANFSALRAEAESVRKAREDAELQQRREEELNRKREDAQYEAFINVADYTSATFLEQCFSSALHSTAYEQAIDELRPRPSTTPVSTVPLTQMEKETIVCGLIDTFILPQVSLEQEKKKGSGPLVERAKIQEANTSTYEAIAEALQSVPKSAWGGGG
eukprot:TRINITY_DN7064_c0_g1_i1.p1 TRINITY_DN7064_c0_g1~~TRINITY_DN7064_c0_g1_i1.p1  ORF type:complete len:677 (+),score=168.14 TRINITY_DN7064_c0_g1_i1:60-2033(+)